MKKQTFTMEEAAEVLGISRNSANGGVRSGEIPSIGVARWVLGLRTAVERLLAREEGTPDAQADRG